MAKQQTILIVEDEPLNRRILRHILEPEYIVREAENGQIAWELLNKKNSGIDAVITDIVMPVMDGYTLIKKIHAADMTDLPVIAATGASDPDSERRVLDDGAWDYVPKPYPPRVLMRRLENALARRQVAYLEQMEYMASHDSLTGLFNRNKMFEQARAMIDANPTSKYAFIRFDIDRFSLYNTSFGEAEGDRLLQFFAKSINKEAEHYEHHVCGRISADIFCLCFAYDAELETIMDQAKSVQAQLNSYRKDYRIEMSAGLFPIDDNSLSIDECYLRATSAMQKCKNLYEVYISVFDATSIQTMKNEMEIANEMQTALDEEQFLIYFQPKVQLSTERACGSEALVRWNHPVKGLISPGLFIPVFEENGFIAKLDYYVWEHTCRILREWIDKGKNPYPVSVNISRVSLYNPNIAGMIRDLVNKYDLPPALLQLEITESAYMSNPDIMRSTLHRFHEDGFTILIDDFGSGYSSLNTLKEIETDVLKIDMKFLPVKENIEKGEVIVASVIKMANWLGMSVVTEGVETRAQRDFLEGAGCDCVQGFYYSRPIPKQDFEDKYLGRAPEASDIKIDETTPAHNMTILIIDDSEVDVAILREYFNKEYHIQACSSAENALAYLKVNHSKIKLILLDNVMPGMSGLEFLKYCRHDNTLDAIPKIMLTANDTPEDQVEALEEGAYDYLVKPLIKQVVVARVNHVMSLVRRTTISDVYGHQNGRDYETDPMTGLLNKPSFNTIATHAIEALGAETTLMMVDIDDFKHVNDIHGHQAGDKVIRCVADSLRGALRKTDLVARFGGDEFVVMMTSVPSRDMVRRKTAELIKQVTLRCAEDMNIDTSISIGVADSNPDDSLETLLSRADQAMYEAKRSGKAKAVIYGERVEPIRDDDKPVILACGDDPQTFPTLALAYGSDAAFANVTSMEELISCFEKYANRICLVCLDTQKRVMADSTEFYRYIVEHGGGKTIPLIAVCRDGNIEQLRGAMELDIANLILLPSHLDTIKYRMDQAMLQMRRTQITAADQE